MRFIVFLIQLLIWFHAEPLFWIIIFLLFISFCVYCVIIDESNNSNKSSSSSTQTPSSSSNNQVNNTQSSSTSASPQNIQWTEVGTYYSNNSETSEQNNNVAFDNDFLNGKNQNFNINELLAHLVGQKDRASGEILQPGEKIYVCEPCQLGYHKDSWEFLDKKCEQCKSSINKLYSLPIAITFTDIPQTQNIESFNGADNLLNSGLRKAKNQTKLEKEQRKQNYNNHDISSRSTKVCEKYISVLDLDTIYENIGKNCYLKGIIISVFIDNQYEIIHFKFSVNTSDSFYAYVPKKSFHLFPNASSLTVKSVIISGKISLNRRNRPVIVINTPSQITEVN